MREGGGCDRIVFPQTRRDRVLLKFAQKFHQQFDNQDYDVVFQFSR